MEYKYYSEIEIKDEDYQGDEYQVFDGIIVSDASSGEVLMDTIYGHISYDLFGKWILNNQSSNKSEFTTLRNIESGDLMEVEEIRYNDLESIDKKTIDRYIIISNIIEEL